MSTSPGYLSDVVAHYERFAQAHTLRADQVHVKVYLADGSQHYFGGIQVFPPAATGGFGLIRGIVHDTGSALAVREQHIVRVEFALYPPGQTLIGLHTEAGARSGRPE